MTGKDISLCWNGFRRKQILRAVHINCREKHGLRWLLEAARGNLWISGQTGRADESTWAAGGNWQWQLNLVILREEKRKKLRKWEYKEACHCYLKQIPCSHSMEPATADWFITAKLWWLRCRAEVNQTRCNSKYKLQKTQISSFSNGSCPPFPAWKRVDQSL